MVGRSLHGAWRTAMKRRTRVFSALGLVLALLLASGSVAFGLSLLQLSYDRYTNADSQHKTQVEPDTFSFGSTIVAAFQTGRFFNGGSSAIGWATSTDGGANWRRGFLPGITKVQSPANPYDRVSDPSVAYDAKKRVWLISSLALNRNPNGSARGVGVLVSRSTDGLNWGHPVVVAGFGNLDKNWIVCDNTATSRFYGHCHVQFDDVAAGARIYMSTSRDGGLTWGPALATADRAAGMGGQPLVQPNGTVVVPIVSPYGASVLAFRSTDGGSSWTSTTTVAPIIDHVVAGGLRAPSLPSAEVDGSGKVYVVWQDCRYRAGCTANDLVMSTSTDGLSWTPPARIPIDPVGSGVDHFIPGLGVDKASSGSSVRLALAYYYYSQADCAVEPSPSKPACQLNVGFISSEDGGLSWSAPNQVAGPMSLIWLANTTLGRMVGDYISTSFVGGSAHAVFAVARVPSGSGVFDEAMYAPVGGLAGAARTAAVASGGEKPIPGATSDRPAPAEPIILR